ncbi:MAG: DeoR/GlpR family DNA-binding transcription regulator [Clostridiales Family XIII bacterium]|jgi:DeoR family fructose operon transcriptional repressor|nr:DeoR/GlpR family DNA-binding transcription regulator [Clostridiales Family XIII bacterium]
MLTEQRFSQILNLIKTRGTVTVQELTDELGASESTIRRDLSTLNEMGKLRKVYGGATSLEMSSITNDDLFSERQSKNRHEKKIIAEYAAKLLAPNDFVYIDSGTSTAVLIDYIVTPGVRFVTNAPNHAIKLAQRGYEVQILGGKYKLITDAIVGGRTAVELEKYNFTKGFFGTNGISVGAGFSTPDDAEAMVKARALKQSQQAYILADSSKFARVSTVSFGTFDSAKVITSMTDIVEFQGLDNVIEVSRI